MCVLLSQDTQQGSLLKALFELIQFMAPDRGIKGVTGVVGFFWLFDSAFSRFLGGYTSRGHPWRLPRRRVQRRCGVMHTDISSLSPFIKLSSNFHQTFIKLSSNFHQTPYLLFFLTLATMAPVDQSSGIARPCQEGNPLPAHAEKEFLW